MAQRRQVGVALGDVGRVADDQVEHAPGQRREPCALMPVDRQTQPLAVAARDRQRRRAEVDRADLRIRPPRLERQRDRAAAGAQIDQRAARRQRGQHVERPVDQRLGVGPRVEHVGRDRQHQAVELVLAGEIGDRHVVAPPGQPVLPARLLRVVEWRVVMRQQPGARAHQQRAEQRHRVRAVQPLRTRLPQRLGDGGHACASISASSSAARAAFSAATTSSRSPSMMAPSL